MNFSFKKNLSYFLLFTLLIMSTFNCNIYASQKNIPNDSRKESQVNFDQMNKVIEENNYTFSIGDNEAMTYPLESLAGLKLPEQLITPSITEPIKPILNLPSKFDWREKDGVTVPKNQGSCGSCWAFATVGVFESLIKIKDKKTVDLSEQFLISYNNDGWGCNGGWFAHKYHVNPGAVLEKDLPYQGSNYAPINNLPHPYKLKNWGYVTNQSSVPSVNAIKSAIYNYGPVSCAVAADRYMQAYTGGVFNHDTYAQVNHAVMIVGWDDNKQAWIMKNSWGTNWGENGFMYIKYGVCDIGYAACYGVY